MEQLSWKIIDKYCNDNPNFLVQHHLDSYNDFFKNGIPRIFKEKNPIKLLKDYDNGIKDFKLQCELYLGGKNGNKIYYGKPTIYDDNRHHFMFPNEARLRNMTYGLSIHYDVDVIYKIYTSDNTIETYEETINKTYLGRFPIMLNSELCILNGLTTDVKFNMGECRNDKGGYFIIDGKEKVVIPQEKFADNMIYIREKPNDMYSHSAEIRSVSEDASKPMRTSAVRIIAPSSVYSNNQIVVLVPNVRKEVPLFILMRALGVLSDKKIIEHCLLDLEKHKDNLDFFIPSIHDSNNIFSQSVALKYIATFTKAKTIAGVHDILMNYFLPHVGEDNYKQKAYFIGYMVFRLLKVYKKEHNATDRDSFKFKRVELTGSLMYDLFKEYFTLQQNEIRLSIDKEYKFHTGQYQGDNFKTLVQSNTQDIFKNKILEDGFRKAFKGNWGSQSYTKKMGVVQPLNRLSFNSFISHLRKLNLPFDSSAKITGPRHLHCSQWGIIDPVDTPDGGNCGLHKHLAFTTHITYGSSGYPMIEWMRKHGAMYSIEECSSDFLSKTTKVFINGAWVGCIVNPVKIENKIKDYRRKALIPIYNSVHWDIQLNELHIYTDYGRLCRPIFYMNERTNRPSFENEDVLKKIREDDFTWDQLITGFYDKKTGFDYKKNNVYQNYKDLYDVNDIDKLNDKNAIIDFIDTAESGSALIAMNNSSLKLKPYTHIEINPSLIFGVMGNQVVFPENNQLPRNLFACGQGKQGVSLYHSNYQNRIDKMGVILNYGQKPLLKSRYLKYIHNEEHPYGENTIVAIMVYGSYNVEDSILFNEGSLNRGMFRTTYYNMYETREESSKLGGDVLVSKFSNIEDENVVGLKAGYDYSHLDKHGLIKENTKLNDKIVLMGKVSNDLENPNIYNDGSVFPKKGQLGYVDKTFMTEGEEGNRLAKVRIREERIPAIGDKFCSRCGQKGTVGLVIPEEDMPFTKDGLKPDIIINPHAIPSRMTIGQLVECLTGKACAIYGGFGDCTAFNNKGPQHEYFGQLLQDSGFHSSGTEILYNGTTGKQLESNIFVGPTYYMRLKHMVKDKINYRARGPRTLLTRQTVQGRANDGGLRIGEMERDCILSHGASYFLKESLMERGDKFQIAICNITGSIAIYNESENLFLSPQCDGPIKFSGTMTDINNINIHKVSKYGRNFSILNVPYAFKLLMQELKTMNIEMKIITEDNIDQMTSLSYSDNFKILNHNIVSDINKLNELNKNEVQKKPKVEEYTKDEAVNPFINKQITYPNGTIVSSYINQSTKKDFEVIGYLDDNLIILKIYDPFSGSNDNSEYIVKSENIAKKDDTDQQKYIDENKRVHDDQFLFANIMDYNMGMMQSNMRMMQSNMRMMQQELPKDNMTLYPIGTKVYYYFMPNVLGEFIVKKHLNNVFVQIEDENNKNNYTVNFDNIALTSDANYLKKLEQTKENNDQKQSLFKDNTPIQSDMPRSPSYDPDMPRSPSYDPDIPRSPSYDPVIPQHHESISNEDLLGLKKSLTKTVSNPDEEEKPKFVLKDDMVQFKPSKGILKSSSKSISKKEPEQDIKDKSDDSDDKSYDSDDKSVSNPDEELNALSSSSDKKISLVIKKKE